MKSVEVRISKDVFSPSGFEEFQGVLEHEVFIYAGNSFEIIDHLLWEVRVIYTNPSLLFVNGSVSGNLKTQCVRCLDDAIFNLDGKIEGYVKASGTSKLPDDIEEDECVLLQSGNYVDLSKLIQGAISLELPLCPVCSESCSGLTEYCSCDRKLTPQVSSPFEVLKNFDF